MTTTDVVLDIGGGWGSFVEFAGRRGVKVTSVTTKFRGLNMARLQVPVGSAA